MSLNRLEEKKSESSVQAATTEPMYLVLKNTVGQYSLWRKGLTIPLGWEDTQFLGTKDQCMKHIDSVWNLVPQHNKSNEKSSYISNQTLFVTSTKAINISTTQTSDAVVENNLNQHASLSLTSSISSTSTK